MTELPETHVRVLELLSDGCPRTGYEISRAFTSRAWPPVRWIMRILFGRADVLDLPLNRYSTYRIIDALLNADLITERLVQADEGLGTMLCYELTAEGRAVLALVRAARRETTA